MRSLRPVFTKLFGIFLLVSCIFGFTKTAGAFSWELPNRDLFSAGGAVNLEIAQAGDYVSLDTQESWVKFYFDTTSSTTIAIQMDNLHFSCNPAAGDNIDAQGNSQNCVDPVDGAGNGSVDYNFFYGNPFACSPAPATSCGVSPKASSFYRVNSSSGLKNTWDEVFRTSAPDAAIPTGIGTEKKVIVYIQAVWRADHPRPAEGRINSYRTAVLVGSGEASYWAGGIGYAVQNRVSQMSGSAGQDAFFNFEFAPQCAAPATQLASLVWNDADAGGAGAPQDGLAFTGDNEPSFDLFEGDPTTGAWTQLTHVDSGGATNGYSIFGGDIGGDGAARQMQFTARNDRIYSWKWYDINYNNGVQMTLPFDSYYSLKKCPPPPSGGNDHGVDGRVFNDLDGDGLFEPGSGENLIKIPGTGCDGSHTDLNVTISTDAYNGGPSICNGPGFGAPFDPARTYAYFHVRSTACNDVLVTVTPPPGWVATAKGATRTFKNVPCGNGYSIYSNDVNDYFGIKQAPTGLITGRVYYDENGDGDPDPGEPYIKNPIGTACGQIYANAVINISGIGNITPSKCNPDPHFSVSVPAGVSYTVSLIPPPGWEATSSPSWPNPSTGVVPVNGAFQPWFGMRIAKPTVLRKCVLSKSRADVTWSVNIPGSTITVDAAKASNFKGDASYAAYPNNGPNGGSRQDVPYQFIKYSGAGVSNTDEFVEGQPHGIRIGYSIGGYTVHSAVTSFTSDKCPELKCGTLSPTEAETNEAITGTVSFENIGLGDLSTSPPGGPAGWAILRMQYAGQTLAVFPFSPQPAPLPPGGIATATFPFQQATAGLYRVDWIVQGDLRANQLNHINVPPYECTGYIKVSDKPYFRAYGGDTVVGVSSPLGTCPGWPVQAGATIKAFAKNDGRGAGAQLAAYTLGQIDSGGFNTTTGKTGPPPGTPQGTGIFPKGLTFANTGAGSFGSSSELQWCPPDYFEAPSRATATPISGTADAATMSGSYYANAGLSVTASSALPVNRKTAIFVLGDVVINNDITYTSSGWSVGNIPSLYVIVKGNIYIQPGVKQLDGVYVAQQNGGDTNTGKIFTCANGAAPPPNETWMISNCRNPAVKLTINGTLIAQRLRLFRLAGTRFAGSSQEVSSSTNIAETINSGPETWLTSPAPFPPAPIGGYDAATSLPPTL